MREVFSGRQLSTGLRDASDLGIDDIGAAADHVHQYTENFLPFTLKAGWATVAGVQPPGLYKVGNFVQVQGTLLTTVAGSTYIADIDPKYSPLVLPLTFLTDGWTGVATSLGRLLQIDSSLRLNLLTPSGSNYVWLALAPIRYVYK